LVVEVLLIVRACVARDMSIPEAPRLIVWFWLAVFWMVIAPPPGFTTCSPPIFRIPLVGFVALVERFETRNVVALVMVLLNRSVSDNVGAWF
jgi:hypothetical protein